MARDVVRHLVEWVPPLLQSGAGIELPEGPSVDDDPAGAWVVMSDAIQAKLIKNAQKYPAEEYRGRYTK